MHTKGLYVDAWDSISAHDFACIDRATYSKLAMLAGGALVLGQEKGGARCEEQYDERVFAVHASDAYSAGVRRIGALVRWDDGEESADPSGRWDALAESARAALGAHCVRSS